MEETQVDNEKETEQAKQPILQLPSDSLILLLFVGIKCCFSLPAAVQRRT